MMFSLLLCNVQYFVFMSPDVTENTVENYLNMKESVRTHSTKVCINKTLVNVNANAHTPYLINTRVCFY